jgi:hypothetical protein
MRMAWGTVYIKGRTDFQSAVISKLENSWLLGSPEVNDDLLMYWVPDTVLLRTLKVAIGSKLIFKYRLCFITNLNQHLNLEMKEEAEFSLLEHEMVNKMVRLDSTQRKQKIQTEITAHE